MNIFFLDKTPEKSAEFLCDKHIPKMLLESCQMLSTAVRRHLLYDDELPYIYKSAYPKHPMTIWVGNSGGNFSWTMKLLEHLLEQYTLRYNKIHTTSRIFNLLNTKHVYWKDLTGDFLDPPLCMPDDCKRDCYIFSYRKYYKEYKLRFAKYTAVDFPEFLC